MTFDASTFAGWPPALVFALIVIVLVTKTLPDSIGPCATKKTSLRSSTAGTSSPSNSTTTQSSEPSLR